MVPSEKLSNPREWIILLVLFILQLGNQKITVLISPLNARSSMTEYDDVQSDCRIA
jgi:Sec-independent protein translocase protein TatA